MMKLFKSMFILLVSGIISTAKADANIDHNILYYAFKSCVGIKKCELSIPAKKNGKYLFEIFNPPHDEFYLKKNDSESYVIFYKNIYSEDVQSGWAFTKVLKEDKLSLILSLNKINLTLGGIEFLKMGNTDNQVESKNYKFGKYYIDDYYDKNPYIQLQLIKFNKLNGNLVLDCKFYMNNSSVKENYSGIFYSVCSDKKVLYFKNIN